MCLPSQRSLPRGETLSGVSLHILEGAPREMWGSEFLGSNLLPEEPRVREGKGWMCIMYIYVCVHTYMCADMYVCHVCICVHYACMCMCVYMQVCICHHVCALCTHMYTRHHACVCAMYLHVCELCICVCRLFVCFVLCMCGVFTCMCAHMHACVRPYHQVRTGPSRTR